MPTIALPNQHLYFPTLGERLVTAWRNVKLAWREAILVPLIVFGIVTATLVPITQPTQVLAVSNSSIAEFTNKERIKRGLLPLAYDETLAKAAENKAADMIAKNYFAHYYQGETPWDFMLTAGDDNWQYAGENLAKNYTNLNQLMQAWMDSPKHRENILNSHYDHIGVAVVTVTLSNGQSVVVTVQMFTGA